MAAPTITWDHVRERLALLARERSEWAGLPLPIEGTRMVIHPSYPFAEKLGNVFASEDSVRVCSASDVNEETVLRNEWCSVRYKCRIRVWQEGKKFFVTYSRKSHATQLINTLKASQAWDPQAEIAARFKLKRHVNERQWLYYLFTGMFLETSKRSGVTYLFRMLRPTVAIKESAGLSGRVGMRVLCTLCSHPIGYYEDSWAGAMVPTDDVLSHLLLMRADEHFLWRISNQSPPWMPEAGL